MNGQIFVQPVPQVGGLVEEDKSVMPMQRIELLAVQVQVLLSLLLEVFVLAPSAPKLMARSWGLPP